MPEVAEKAFDLLEAISLETLELMARIEKVRKALRMVGGMEKDMKDRLMPAIEQAYEERGDITASMRKFQFDRMRDALMGGESRQEVSLSFFICIFSSAKDFGGLEMNNVGLNKMLKGTVIAVYGNDRLFGERMGWSEATVSQVLHGRRRLTKKGSSQDQPSARCSA